MRKVVNSIIRIINKGTEDSLPAYAAQTAFFVMLSFFPFVIMIIMAATQIPFARQNIVAELLDILPAEFHSYIMYLVDDIMYDGGGSFTLITVLLTMWSAGKGIQAVTYGLNKVYGVERARGFILTRLISALYTIIFMFICVALMILNAFGNDIAAKIVSLRPELANATALLLSVKGVLTFMIFFIFILLIYYQLPNRKGRFKDEAFGAIFAAFAWMVMTRGFAIYMRFATKVSYMYGSLTSIVVILIWLYVGMQIILYGAEFNSLRPEFFKKAEKPDSIDRDVMV
ncbi:MAG: YihY/virulence factor BrkB family protein [Lachnospiraceae bacterium]|nr:YihY/virulence factor BrkB family protein [Lachnospiraceae bacterium]